MKTGCWLWRGIVWSLGCAAAVAAGKPIPCGPEELTESRIQELREQHWQRNYAETADLDRIEDAALRTRVREYIARATPRLSATVARPTIDRGLAEEGRCLMQDGVEHPHVWFATGTFELRLGKRGAGLNLLKRAFDAYARQGKAPSRVVYGIALQTAKSFKGGGAVDRKKAAPWKDRMVRLQVQLTGASQT